MATDFFSGQIDDEEKKKQQEGEIAAPADAQTGQESAIVTGNNQQPQQGQGTRSGSFTNLQSYLDANESSKFGKQVADQVEGEIDKSNQAQSEAGSAFKQRADSNVIGLNQNLLQKVNSDPVSVASDPNQKSEFVKMRDAQYKGPKNFVDAEDIYSPVNQSVSEAKNSAEMAVDESGRKSLLDKYYGANAGRNDYTSGQKKLDNYLVQVDPNSRQYFQDAKEKSDQSVQKYNELTNVLGQYGQQKAQETANTRKATRDVIGLDENSNETGGGALGSSKNEIENAYRAALQRYKDDQQRATSQLQAKDIDADYAKRFGLSEGMRTWGYNPSNYLRVNAAPEKSSVATKDQAAKLQALYDLAGNDNTYLPYGKIGEYDPNGGVSFLTDQFMNDIRGKESLYNEAVNRKAFTSTGGVSNGDSGFNGAPRGMTPEQVAQAYGVDGLGVDSGYVEGSILDNIGALDNEMNAQGNDPRYWTNQRPRYEATKNQFQALLNALQNKYNYGDTLK